MKEQIKRFKVTKEIEFINDEFGHLLKEVTAKFKSGNV